MDGLGHVEWLGCHLAEVCYKDFSLADRDKFLPRFNIQAVVDCKSIYDHVQSFSSPASVSDKRVAIDLVIVKETLRRLGATVRWCPTQLQLADALTKENAEAMDMLRAAINSCKYHLNSESQMMAEAAKQRQVRLDRRSTVAPKVVTSSPTLLVRCAGPMVKVSAAMIKEDEVRAFFEAVANEVAGSEAEYASTITQNRSSCSVKVPLMFINEKKFKGLDAKVTYRYHKTTQMITVQGPAAYLDEAERMMGQVLQAFKSLVENKEVQPMPTGGRQWGGALNYMMKNGVQSMYLLAQDTEDTIVDAKTIQQSKQKYLPSDPEFRAAVAELCHEGSRKLRNFPLWKQKYLQTMLGEFGADPDTVLELSDQPEQFALSEDEWVDDLKEAKPKAKAKAPSLAHAGYRGSSCVQ